MTIKTKFNHPITVAELLQLYRTADFAQEKLADDPKRLQTMLAHTQLTATLWDQDRLIGLARCLTDYEYSCYLSEIVISPEYRGQGLGKRLLNDLQSYLGDRVSIMLRADHSAINFYSKIGCTRIDNLFRIHREKSL